MAIEIVEDTAADPDDEDIVETDDVDLDVADPVETEETAETAEAPDELDISLGEEPEAHDDAHWVTELRKREREALRQNRELQRELEALRQPVQAKPLTKPTLESCEYDPDKFEVALADYVVEDAKRKATEKAQVEAAAAQQKAAADKVQAYQTAKASLPVADFESAEETVLTALSVQQQNVLLHCSPAPEKIVYALGRAPKALAELAKITDPAKFIYALAQMEATKLTATPKKPAPETRVNGGGAAIVRTSNSSLEQARERAAKTGDYSQVMQIKAQLRAVGK